VKLLTVEEIILLHDLVISRTGGEEGIRDEGLLISSVENIKATFDAEDLYPTLINKAAQLGFSLINNHGFVDGNKRVGVLAMLIMLETNNISITASNDEIVELGLKTADGRYTSEDIVGWIETRLK